MEDVELMSATSLVRSNLKQHLLASFIMSRAVASLAPSWAVPTTSRDAISCMIMGDEDQRRNEVKLESGTRLVFMLTLGSQ